MLLLRGATQPNAPVDALRAFQYMLLLRGATRSQSSCIIILHVSIHAPLARSNLLDALDHLSGNGFNTCSSCEEQRDESRRGAEHSEGFNTCSSCEEQRGGLAVWRQHTEFQYMLLLRGATFGDRIIQRGPIVSIHAPLARSNPSPGSRCHPHPVSIHAPLARSNLN